MRITSNRHEFWLFRSALIVSYLTVAACSSSDTTGSIPDAGNLSDLSVVAVVDAAVVVDAAIAVDYAVRLPRIVAVTSSVANGTYGQRAKIPIVVQFDTAVTVTGMPRLAINARAMPIDYTDGSGTNALTFTYTVAAGENVARLDYTDSAALQLNGATIVSANGNAEITLPATGAAGSLGVTKQIAIVTGSMNFAYTGKVDTFTVPAGVTSIDISAAGAEGGTSTGEGGGLTILGGKGALATATFVVTGGDALSVLVGGSGGKGTCGSGGGGGTWVVRNTDLLIVAGGGGGGFNCNVLGSVIGSGGRDMTSGGDGTCNAGRSPLTGGADGKGGMAYYGGGGGGWLTAGVSTQSAGSAGNKYPGAAAALGGGYGGGGGYHSTCCGGSGGGGGYSGGSGSASDGCSGGGGGSYTSGGAAQITANSRAGNGTVTISW